ncbi:hypothetical protein CspeluHIS016_0201350 [Cutaneotrichosporon spelunceum]|uniref:Uncharacterized protein n=1 Tax=Cutaneotrichosporon spelunceum TaxID=1672016 RepID=A0AAD3TQV2_9TREE|nr:hypothetical protein CspeluHIS016_0201350 [Cutaneotrichosporon spelunceum]
MMLATRLTTARRVPVQMRTYATSDRSRARKTDTVAGIAIAAVLLALGAGGYYFYQNKKKHPVEFEARQAAEHARRAAMLARGQANEEAMAMAHQARAAGAAAKQRLQGAFQDEQKRAEDAITSERERRS